MALAVLKELLVEGNTSTEQTVLRTVPHNTLQYSAQAYDEIIKR
jgi:hypothetical protein